MRSISDEKKIVLEKLGGPAPRRLASDTARRFFLDVTASGHVFIRERGERAQGGLPVFSTNTKHEAEMLRVRHCHLARVPGSDLYQLNDPPVDIGDLDRITVLFRNSYKPKTSAPAANARKKSKSRK